RRWSEIEGVFGAMHINGVFSAEGGDWKRQRRLAVSALNTNHLNRYFDVIHTTTERLRKKWSLAADSGEVVDIQRDFMSLTVDITSALAFGHDLNTIERADNELQAHIETIFPMIARRISSPFAYWRWLKLSGDRACDRSLTAVRDAVDEFVRQARERLDRHPELRERPTNFLESMLVAHDQDDGAYSEDEVFGNTFTMLLAGEDTTANTLAWTTWYLARRPDVLARVRAEADRRLGEQLLPGDFETAGGATYVDAVVKESMRLKPVAPIFFMESLTDGVVAGTTVSPGTRIILLTRYAATRAHNFERPGEFDPGRWIDAAASDDEHPGGAHNPSAYVPFGAGPRFCPGRNLALIEAKSVLMMLARNFEVQLASSEAIEERFAFTMSPSELKVRLAHRDVAGTASVDAAAGSRDAAGAYAASS
ncbi:MAG: cytochrome P450, partial [Solirubrobacterales bacterium]